ncbi:TauD/TfdA family dioxygenase [Streptomyces sp. NPDC002082]|uniref:TauD/TfdA family dioxygenase n=1 Tax=Streptomyces sp. NPDC002082 TaxID=3154772 RepID=UPI0033282469
MITRELPTTLVQTFRQSALDDGAHTKLADRLRALPDPSGDLDHASAVLLQAFAATLPTAQLQEILDFGRHADAPGVMLVENLPVDLGLPPTPADGEPAVKEAGGHVAENVIVGLSGLLGEPIGFQTEKAGRAIHDVVPVSKGATTQTNQGSRVFLNFHNDIVYDAQGRYDVSNPDFLVLNCLRQDPQAKAVTYYADARDISAILDEDSLRILRAPLFRLNAPGSYCRDVAGKDEVLSDPVAIIHGPASSPEIAVSANGVRGLTPEAETALAALQEACRDERICHQVTLRPGQALLINNRKGLHARSAFPAFHDGTDRWLQRTYVRRTLWPLRDRGTDVGPRVFA